jgi:hypothetical protein
MAFAQSENLQELVGSLTKSELLALFPPNTFSCQQSDTWRTLFNAIAPLPVNVKQVISEAREAKDTVRKMQRRIKRKENDDRRRETRRVRRRLLCASRMYPFLPPFYFAR